MSNINGSSEHFKSEHGTIIEFKSILFGSTMQYNMNRKTIMFILAVSAEQPLRDIAIQYTTS